MVSARLEIWPDAKLCMKRGYLLSCAWKEGYLGGNGLWERRGRVRTVSEPGRGNFLPFSSPLQLSIYITDSMDMFLIGASTCIELFVWTLLDWDRVVCVLCVIAICVLVIYHVCCMLCLVGGPDLEINSILFYSIWVSCGFPWHIYCTSYCFIWQ